MSLMSICCISGNYREEEAMESYVMDSKVSFLYLEISFDLPEFKFA